MAKPAYVFIVDDDIDDLEMFITAITECNRQVKCYTALNGEQALDKLKSPHLQPPDLILLDLNMPVMDGKEFLRQIKKDARLSHIPVAILTTSDWDGDAKETIQLGASYFFSKPSSYNALKVLIGSILQTQLQRGGGQPSEK